VVFPALILFPASCTGGSGRPSPAGRPPATERGAASGTPTASVCTRLEDRTAISRFFDAWNDRDPPALGRQFTVNGVLDMATKAPGHLHKHVWTNVGGLGARRMIAAFAERQWRLGEKLSYRGGARAVARFADGTVQPMAETKFVYHWASHAFARVVIVSAKAAAPA